MDPCQSLKEMIFLLPRRGTKGRKEETAYFLAYVFANRCHLMTMTLSIFCAWKHSGGAVLELAERKTAFPKTIFTLEVLKF